MHGSEPPSPWIARFAHLVAAGGTVLDVACGTGRHSVFFAARGCRVDAVDRDVSLGGTLEEVGNVRFLAADIEAGPWPFAGRRFDAVVVTNYLHRPLFPALCSAVADGGVMLYETFARGNEKFGKPSNPAFLLEPGELLRAFAPDFTIVAFEDGVVAAPRDASVQRVCAVRGAGVRNPLFENVARGVRG